MGSKGTEELEPYIGPFGRWHLFIYFVSCISDFPMLSFVMTFYAPNIDFWCARPDHLKNDISVQEWRNISSPVNSKTESRDQCFRYDVDYHNLTALQVKDISTNKTVPCTHWEYDLGLYDRTMRSEFDLVCSRDILISTSNAVYMSGFMIGVIFSGHMADRFGRRKVIIIETFGILVFSTAMIFSQNFIMFMILRWFQIFFRIGAGTTGYVLFLENCSEKHRAAYGNTLFWGFALGMTAFAGIAYGLRNWVYIQISIAAPFVIFLLLSWFLPESPRWLVTKGKLEEATKEINRAAAINRVDLEGKEEELQKKLTQMHQKECEANEGKKNYTIIDLLRLPNMRKKTLNMFFCWAVNAFVYYGLSFNTNNLGGDPFINFFIASAVEIPAYIMAAISVTYVGRKIPLMMFMVIGGLACASPIVIPEEMEALNVAFPMIGKLCISGSFSIIYVYASELFPTVARNIGVGSCSMVARFGSILAPYVKELGTHTHKLVPLALYGILSISSGLLVLLLPETKSADIPDSLQEAELITRHNTGSKALKNKDEVEMKQAPELSSNGEKQQ